jgi:AcrR family transcriptional regulator
MAGLPAPSAGRGRDDISERKMTLEEKKNRRRQQIISAAEELVRETGSTDFSMNTLAERAGFSTPTTYNLIGSKGTVLYILLNQYQDRLDNSLLRPKRTSDPFAHVLHASDVAVKVYTGDSSFIRSLMRFLLGIPDPIHRPAFMTRGYQYWWRAFQGLEKHGYLGKGVSIDDVSRDFVVYFSGVIDFWVHEELDDKQFHIQARVGVLMRLLAIADDQAMQEKLRRELEKCHRKMKPLYPAPPQSQ